jgi:hypothetical protein
MIHASPPMSMIDIHQEHACHAPIRTQGWWALIDQLAGILQAGSGEGPVVCHTQAVINVSSRMKKKCREKKIGGKNGEKKTKEKKKPMCLPRPKQGIPFVHKVGQRRQARLYCTAELILL